MSEKAQPNFKDSAEGASAPEAENTAKPALPKGVRVESQSEYMARLEDENIERGLTPGMPS